MTSDYWRNADRNWDGMAFPLKPGTGEAAIYRSLLGPKFASAECVLILGVTTLLQELGWPSGCAVDAADKSGRMIERFWQGDAEKVMQCDWREIPRADAVYDAIVTDGGTVMVDYPGGQRALAGSVRRLLRPDGCFVARCYVTPEDHPPFSEVRAEFLAGNIGNMSAYKLLAGMAIARESSGPAYLSEVYRRTMEGVPDREAFQRMTGCVPAEIASFENYRDAVDAYHFVGRTQLISAMADSGLTLVAEEASAASWGHLCPVMRFEPSR